MDTPHGFNEQLYFMAPQQLTMQEATNTYWLNKSSIKLVGIFVAVLLFTALLYSRYSNNGEQQGCTTTTQQQILPTMGGGTHAKDTQCSIAEPASSFSVMPGGLSRFLQ